MALISTTNKTKLFYKHLTSETATLFAVYTTSSSQLALGALSRGGGMTGRILWERKCPRNLSGGELFGGMFLGVNFSRGNVLMFSRKHFLGMRERVCSGRLFGGIFRILHCNLESILDQKYKVNRKGSETCYKASGRHWELELWWETKIPRLDTFRYKQS